MTPVYLITHDTNHPDNAYLRGEKSSGAVSFSNLVALLVMWLGISVPLVFVGANLAKRSPPTAAPVKINPLARKIVNVPEGLNALAPVLLGGSLPFAACFVEIYFIMTSVWQHQFYYLFGFLFLVYLLLIISCAEISIVTVYFQLCRQDYRWWWTAFLASGSAALYLFLYSILYYFSAFDGGCLVTAMLYFGYMFLTCFAFFLMAGAIGTCATFWFVNKIYSSVKVD